MPRPIIGAPKIEKTESRSVKSQGLQALGLTGNRLTQRLRMKRSRRYIEAMSKIDAGTYQSDQKALESLLHEISTEFPELRIDQAQGGFVDGRPRGSVRVVD